MAALQPINRTRLLSSNPTALLCFPEHALTPKAATEAAFISRGAVNEELLVQWWSTCLVRVRLSSQAQHCKEEPSL